MSIAKEINSIEQISQNAQGFYEVYMAQKNYKKAIEYYVLNREMSDSLINEDKI